MSETESSPSPLSSRLLEWINLGLVILGLLWVVFKGDRDWFLAFGLGGLLSVFNLRLWRLLVGGLTGQKKFSRPALVFLALLKLLVLFGSLGLILLYVQPPILPFLLGLSTLVAAILLQGLWGMVRN